VTLAAGWRQRSSACLMLTRALSDTAEDDAVLPNLAGVVPSQEWLEL
jgi:hypothetical protein